MDVPRPCWATSAPVLPFRATTSIATGEGPLRPWPSTLVSCRAGPARRSVEGSDVADDDEAPATATSPSAPLNGDGIVFSSRVCLRPATVDDLETVLRWDEAEHMQDCMGDKDSYNDWDWKHELGRDPDLAWRRQLVAEAFAGIAVGGAAEERERAVPCRRPIGFVQVIDPALEESRYWAQARQEERSADNDEDKVGGDGLDEVDFAALPPFVHRAIDIWIGEEDCLGVGYGTEMMQLALDRYCFGRTDGTDDSNVTTVWVDPMADNVSAHRFYQRFGFRPVGIRYFGPDRTLVHRLDRAIWEERRKANIKDVNE